MTENDSPPAPQFDVQALRIDRGARRKRRKKRSWTSWIVILALLGGLGWLFQRQIVATVERFRLPQVEVASVVVRSAGAAAGAAGVSANGYVIARTRAALSADTPGRIVELNVVEGTRLKEGDVVARLYFDEFQAALDQAEADVLAAQSAVERAQSQVVEAETNLQGLEASRQASEARVAEAQVDLTFARIERQRLDRLIAEGIESQQTIDNAQRGLEAADARMRSAQADLGRAVADLERGRSTLAVAKASLMETRTRVPLVTAARDLAAATLEKTFVRAPFDGIVTQKEAEIGEVVSPNSQGGSLARGSVVTMVDMKSLEVQADVPETTLSQVRQGGPARIYLDAFPDDAYPGRVDRIWPTADRQKATVEVRVAFDSTDDRLRPEMGVRVVFLDEEPTESEAQDSGPVVLIEEAAVVNSEQGTGAFLVEGDTVRFQVLDLDASQGRRRAVTSGLEGGELVVLNPPRDLADGDRVGIRSDG